MFIKLSETLTALGVRYTWPAQAALLPPPVAAAAGSGAPGDTAAMAAAAAVVAGQASVASFAVGGADPAMPQLDKKLL